MQHVLNELAKSVNENNLFNYSDQTRSDNRKSPLTIRDDKSLDNDLNNNENIDLEVDPSGKRLNILCCIMCQNDNCLIDTLLAPILNQSFYHKILSTSTNSILIETHNSLNKQIVI